MSSSDRQREREVDARLRAVPVPDGLTARLRKVALADDEGLDAALRAVPLPEGLVDRVRWAVWADDEALDEAVREVSVPRTMAARVKRQMVAQVLVPRMAQWAVAVSLVIGIGLSYIGAMSGLVWSTFSEQQPSGPALVSWTGEMVTTVESGPVKIAPVGFPVAQRTPREGEFPDLLPRISLTQFREPRSVPVSEWKALFDPTNIAAGADPMLDANLFRWGPVFGKDPVYDEQPELKKVAHPKAQGIRFPLVPGYDWAIQPKYGVYPFMAPVAHPELCSHYVPLGVTPDSYELLRRYLEDGELPPRELLHTEEFLAAIDYHYRKPQPGDMGLHLAGAPSPSKPGMLLLQVGVQAPDVADLARSGVSVTLAVDVSSSMRMGGRLAMVRNALNRLVDRLGPQDRCSLVAFSGYAEVLLEDVGIDEAKHIRTAIDRLKPRSSTNIGEGLRFAYAVAQETAKQQHPNSCVILVTDGLADLDLGTSTRIEDQLSQAAGEGILLHVIDLSADTDRTVPERQLVSLAQAGGGRARRAASTDQIDWALREMVTDKSQQVAADVQLQMTFNPKTVLAYRLLGYEPNLKTAALKTDFYSGQSTTVLYEVRLRPSRSGEGEVATAELSWRHGTVYQRAVRKINRQQFASRLIDAPLSVQAAAVVAEVAELLRYSPYAAEGARPALLVRVREMAENLDTRLYDWPSFTEFLSVVEKAQRARQSRGGVRAPP